MKSTILQQGQSQSNRRQRGYSLGSAERNRRAPRFKPSSNIFDSTLPKLDEIEIRCTDFSQCSDLSRAQFVISNQFGVVSLQDSPNARGWSVKKLLSETLPESTSDNNNNNHNHDNVVTSGIMLPSTTVKYTFNYYKVAICLDLSQAAFTVFNDGQVPFNFVMKALKQTLIDLELRCFYVVL